MAKKNESVPKKSADIAHALNNCLTTLSLSAEVLQKELFGELNGQQKKYVADILAESKKMEQLVKKIPRR